MYNKLDPIVRRRFTVAHEIGHIVLEHIPREGVSEQVSKNAQEKEANVFASELLIPRADLKKFVANKDKSLSDIKNRYEVSKEAATYAVMNTKGLLNKLKAEEVNVNF